MKKAVISVVVLLTVLTAFYFIASTPTQDESEYNQLIHYDFPTANISDTLSVTTFNLGYLSGMTNNLAVTREESLFENNLQRAKVLFSKVKPDLAGLQEVDFGSSRSFDTDQLERIVRYAEYPFVYKSINWDRRYVPFPYWPVSKHFGKIVSGQAILSRFVLTADSTVKLIKPAGASLLYRAFYLDRLIQIVNVEIGGRTVKLMNLHLEAFDEETRTLQAQVAKNLFEKYADEMPVLLIGDFNSSPAVEAENQKAMEVIMKARHIASAVSDSVYELSPQDFYTFNSDAPYQMIDYILYNKNFIQNISSRVVKEAGEISDHLPVLMKFTLKAEIGRD